MWARQQQLEALFLHRLWRLGPDVLPAGTGVLGYHLAFDSRLTFGFNPRLAAALGMAHPVPFAWQKQIPLGMFGDIASTTLAILVESLERIFHVTPRVEYPRTKPLQRIAVVGALNAGLIYEAAEQHIQAYVTGQWRETARQAARDSAISVITIGHRAGELWGLRSLADLLREHLPTLEVVLAPEIESPSSPAASIFT